jgi:hypothetical protein
MVTSAPQKRLETMPEMVETLIIIGYYDSTIIMVDNGIIDINNGIL